jgi:hypothetical protein
MKTSKCQAHQERRLVLFSLSAKAQKKKKNDKQMGAIERLHLSFGGSLLLKG